jgi:ATP-dependent exoDNAse (exonuclease V) beta subunit
MNNPPARPAPPDQPQRDLALDSSRSILVQAPAGSGKTDLLTRRFLRLLGEVEDPGQIVAITFTKAAAAEMRNRIMGELENAAAQTAPSNAAGLSMDALARRALQRSASLGWNLLDLPAQLQISTIDSFCRNLALQQPMLSTLGGGIDVNDQPGELYRRAARRTLERIDNAGSALGQSIEKLLLWRDNDWQELENELVEMLGKRDKWMQDFVLGREPDNAELEALRLRLERPFANAIRELLGRLGQHFDAVPGALDEALHLARFGCTQCSDVPYASLAELAEFPSAPFTELEALEDAREAYLSLASLLLTGAGTFRKAIDKRLGFPADCKPQKARLLALIQSLQSIANIEPTLAAVRGLPPIRYAEDDWQIVRACFTLLRHASAELQVVFAEVGAVDFIEVAQIASRVLKGEDGYPSDAAQAVADGIRHLLVDEFQDTSRRQHQLISGIVAAWPERTGRTCFVVGDPMQSIYFFRDSDTELFQRVKEIGLEVFDQEPLSLEPVSLSANFRTAPPLVEQLNDAFQQIFAADDGSGIAFSPAQPARADESPYNPRFNLHLTFVPQTGRGKPSDPDALNEKQAAAEAQTAEIVALIQSHIDRIEQARALGKKYRVAVLGRTRSALRPVAEALHQAGIPFRAVDLEMLASRPEVLDALTLARALLNPMDRVAWLGVLRAPWCGLSLENLHRLTSADDAALLSRPVPELLAERLSLLAEEDRQAAQRVLQVLETVPALRAAQPTASLGTWLEQVWLRLGGAGCVDGAARANLDLLWGCLDRLPAGEQDLLGPALDAALAKLTAQPDPAASTECGVQLMTIHHSKGLEFEVVIVPDLQAGSGSSGRRMLSWLERGLAAPDDFGEITEFLIAPFQTKGNDRSNTKLWVDAVYRERETQEMRRILYVAATRAREELHFFARPACKVESNGDLSLLQPTNCLLATAWPALEAEVRASFETWKANQTGATTHGEQVIQTIAAEGQSNLLVMPSPAVPTILRRLPPDYRRAKEEGITQPGPGSPTNAEMPRAPSFPRPFAERVGNHHSQPATSTFEPHPPGAPGLDFETRDTTLYSRHQGALFSRALGTAVHAFLEELARLRTTQDWGTATAALLQHHPRIAAQIRAAGIDPAQAAVIATQALHQALNAAQDPAGQWILSPHTDAASEVSWAGVIAGALRTVRVDRVFRAGTLLMSEGENCWWVIDYKTAHADAADPAASLPALRNIFAPQVEAYAQVLRNLHGADAPIRAGLYYPRMLLFDWWEP